MRSDIGHRHAGRRGRCLSAARPGARRETLETYIKRLEKLEEISESFEGVEKSYAIQAGREVRVMVQPEKIDDAEAFRLARDITKKIESELDYPGHIKVTVIRETRAVEYAQNRALRKSGCSSRPLFLLIAVGPHV